VPRLRRRRWTEGAEPRREVTRNHSPDSEPAYVCRVRWFTRADNGPGCRGLDPALLGRPGADDQTSDQGRHRGALPPYIVILKGQVTIPVAVRESTGYPPGHAHPVPGGG
jgi:hypothetical protein